MLVRSLCAGPLGLLGFDGLPEILAVSVTVMGVDPVTASNFLADFLRRGQRLRVLIFSRLCRLVRLDHLIRVGLVTPATMFYRRHSGTHGRPLGGDLSLGFDLRAVNLVLALPHCEEPIMRETPIMLAEVELDLPSNPVHHFPHVTTGGYGRINDRFSKSGTKISRISETASSLSKPSIANPQNCLSTSSREAPISCHLQFD